MSYNARSSNGRTTDSGSVYLGSNPSWAAKKYKKCYIFNMDNQTPTPATETTQIIEDKPPHKSSGLKIVISFILLISLFGAGFFIYSRYFSNFAQQVNVAPEVDPVSPTTEVVIDGFSFNDELNQFESVPNATFEALKPEDVSSKIQLAAADVENINESVNSLEDGPLPCQPDFFDPKTSNIYKVNNADQTASELYAIQGYGTENQGVMMIDKVEKEGYDVTVYKFRCEGPGSFVLDLYKDGIRKDLYTHVSNYSFSNDGKKLFLLNSVNVDGSWTFKKRIIDIETNTATDIMLPHTKDCSLNRFEWHGEKIIASCAYDEAYQPPTNFNSLIYIIDNNGAVLAKIEANTATNIGILDSYGLLPKDSNIFYLYTDSKVQEGRESEMIDVTCSLYMLDITKTDRGIKKVDLVNVKDAHPYVCTSEYVRLRLENLTYDGGSLLHAYKINSSEGTAPEYTAWTTVENK